jgi:hypothetical protein
VEHKQQLEEVGRKQEEKQKILNTSSPPQLGKSSPPPIPEINPWAPQEVEASSSLSMGYFPAVDLKKSLQNTSVLDQYLTISASIFCIISLLSGHFFREGSGIFAVAIGISLLVRRRFSTGVILIVIAIISYFTGILLTDLIHDYLIKNYPH